MESQLLPRAAVALPEPQTADEPHKAELPQSALKAVLLLLPQTAELPQRAEVPLTVVLPQTAEVPQTAEDPHTAELPQRAEVPQTAEALVTNCTWPEAASKTAMGE